MKEYMKQAMRWKPTILKSQQIKLQCYKMMAAATLLDGSETIWYSAAVTRKNLNFNSEEMPMKYTFIQSRIVAARGLLSPLPQRQTVGTHSVTK